MNCHSGDDAGHSTHGPKCDGQFKYPRNMVESSTQGTETANADGAERAEDGSAVNGMPRAGNRERILEAAVNEFAELGFAGARVDRIAKESGLNKQLIYHYFGNKRGLYEAAFESLVLKVRGTLPDGEIDGSAVVRGMGVTRRTDSSDAARSELDQITYGMSRFIVWEALAGQGTGADLAEKRTENYRAAIGWVRKSQQKGEIRADVPAELITGLLVVAGGVPYSMPNVLRFVTDRETIRDSDKQKWDDFVWRVLQPPK